MNISYVGADGHGETNRYFLQFWKVPKTEKKFTFRIGRLSHSCK